MDHSRTVESDHRICHAVEEDLEEDHVSAVVVAAVAAGGPAGSLVVCTTLCCVVSVGPLCAKLLRERRVGIVLALYTPRARWGHTPKQWNVPEWAAHLAAGRPRRTQIVIIMRPYI